MKRVFIIHGWGGNPEEGWFPWLKSELEKRDYYVEVPEMPDTENPKIETWVPFLKNIVGKLDKETYFVGHNIGCQTVLRYLEEENKQCCGAVLVAPWLHLDENTIRDEGEESVMIAKPWVETPIDFDKIKRLGKFVDIYSDNDPYVPVSDSKIFRNELNAETISVGDKEHINGEAGVKRLPIVLEKLIEISH